MSGPAPAAGRLRIVGTGDIMLGRGVHAAPVDSFETLISPGVAEALSGDVVTGNLECVLGSAGAPNPLSHVHFRADPRRAATLLKRFDVVSLANNHINDFGPEAISQTMEELDRLGVRHAGVGRTPDEAREPVVFDRAGHHVAVFAATTVSPLPAGGLFTAAAPDAGLYAALRHWKNRGAVCVLHLHTGGGDFEHPAPFVTDLMQEIAGTGTDLVLAHHPHIVQGRQTIGSTQVFYSLGDFIFDRFENGRDTALIVHADFAHDESAPCQTATIPVRRSASLQLDLIEGSARETFRQRLETLDAMIADGRSRAAFQAAYGNPLRRVLAGTLSDFRAGGWPALWAKARRVDRRRLSLLASPLLHAFRIKRRHN